MLSAVRAFFDFLAKMGLSIRDDPPKTIELGGREWGAEVNGFVLSAQARPGILSVILRNVSEKTRDLTAPEFSRWFEVVAEGAELTEFGRRLRAGVGQGAPRPLQLAPGQAVEAEIPLDPIYRLTRGVEYSVRASCEVDGATIVRSNGVVFTAGSV